MLADIADEYDAVHWAESLQEGVHLPGARETGFVLPAPATFVPVRMAVDSDAFPAIEVVLGGGERLHVRTGASADLVRAAVTALPSPW